MERTPESTSDAIQRLQQVLALKDARLERLRLTNAALAEKLKVVRAELVRACEHAYHDPLTGLPNRTLLLDRLHQAITQCARKGRQCALLFLDLDDFKAVNDNYGHQAADEVLCLLAQRLQLCLRADDTFGRLSGDEFLLLLPEIRARADALEVARKVLELSAAPYPIDTHELQVTLSMGIAIFPDDGSGVESLLKSADVALYRAKAGHLKVAQRESSRTMLAAGT